MQGSLSLPPLLSLSLSLSPSLSLLPSLRYTLSLPLKLTIPSLSPSFSIRYFKTHNILLSFSWKWKNPYSLDFFPRVTLFTSLSSHRVDMSSLFLSLFFLPFVRTLFLFSSLTFSYPLDFNFFLQINYKLEAFKQGELGLPT
jgi:hypothetical protein